MITNIYTVPNTSGDDMIKYFREKDEVTGFERLLEPHEVVDPDLVEVGDEEAYKVSLLSPRVFDKPPFY